MAAVSQNPLQEWLPAHESSSGAGSRKEEWGANELRPIPASLEIGAGGGVKCGIGVEEWENVFSGSTSPAGNDRSTILQWFPEGLDGSSLAHLLQSGAAFENAGAGIEVPDMGFGFEPANANAAGHHLAAVAPEFPPLRCFNSSPNPLPSFKAAFSNASPPNTMSSSTSSDLSPPLSRTPSLLFNQQVDLLEEKPQLWNPQHHNQFFTSSNPPFLFPSSYDQHEHQLLPIHPKHPHLALQETRFQIPKPPFSDSGQEELFLRQQKQQLQSFSRNVQLVPQPHLEDKQANVMMKVGSSAAAACRGEQVLADQLFLAAEMIEAGEAVNAQEILARLNHQISPDGKPFRRVAFYLKEALQLVLDASSSGGASCAASPLDTVLKISSYKLLSEVSPLVQFVNFTSNQLLLEALDGFRRIHIVDFDVGYGGQWASLMQELALRPGGPPSLKITSFASSSSQDPVELLLAKESLCHFAAELSIPFEFNFLNLDSLYLHSSAVLPFLDGRSEGEAVALNLRFWTPSPSALNLLLKHLSPRIVLAVGDRSELSFPHFIPTVLRSCSLLLDSIESTNVNPEAVQRIERFLIQPKIETLVLRRRRGATEKMLPLRGFLASAGYSPMPFSNFAETQADYVLSRIQLKGFNVEKRPASLCLCWKQGELVSVSAWMR